MFSQSHHSHSICQSRRLGDTRAVTPQDREFCAPPRPHRCTHFMVLGSCDGTIHWCTEPHLLWIPDLLCVWVGGVAGCAQRELSACAGFQMAVWKFRPQRWESYSASRGSGEAQLPFELGTGTVWGSYRQTLGRQCLLLTLTCRILLWGVMAGPGMSVLGLITCYKRRSDGLELHRKGHSIIK